MAVVAAVATTLLSVDVASGQSFQKDLEKFGSFYYYLNSLYVEGPDNATLIEEAIRSTLERLDPHSAYLTAEQVKAEMDMFDGAFGGVGVSFGIVRDELYVISTSEGSPAHKASLAEGDKIVAIDGRSTKGIHRDSLTTLVRGKVGSPITLSVVKHGAYEAQDVVLQRGEIAIPTIDAAYTLYNIGYIKVNRFAENTMEEFRKAFESLGPIEGFILDLRGNGGGLLRAGIDLAGFFLPRNTLITSTSGRTEQTYNHYSKTKGKYTNGPVVVLIDEFSASASELVAGALQDYDRAVIVGRQSFGKGLVQKQVVMDDGSALRITTSHYYTPSGRCIQRPFEKGKTAEYYFDHAKRMTDRRYRDSLAVVAPKYKTLKNGRMVLGGGGITPDVYIDHDTTKDFTFANELQQRWIITDLANETFVDNREALRAAYPTIEDFVKGYSTPEALIDEAVRRGSEEGIEVDEDSLAQSRELVGYYLKSALGSAMWGSEGGVRVANSHTEPTFGSAMSIIADRARYNAVLGIEN